MVMEVSGSRRVYGAVSAPRNVGDVERALSILGGTALAIACTGRRGTSRAVLAAVGAELVRRGATGRCRVYEALGVSTATTKGYAYATDRAEHDLVSLSATVDARNAIKIERSVLVARARDDVYRYYRDFRNHPRFTRYVEPVEILSPTRSHWRMNLGGRRIQFDCEVINDIPGVLIAWKSVAGSDVAHAGSVHFRDVPGGTEVKVVVAYEPPGGRLGHIITKALGMSPEQFVGENLRRFRDLMEARDYAGRAVETLSGER